MGIPPRSRGSAIARARSSLAARRLVLPAQKFVYTEATSGIVLLIAAIVAITWANLSAGNSYEAFWNTEVSVHFGQFILAHNLREWINDALMVVFFFVVGLEVKREFVHGELAEWRRASLPVVCALGGMLVPAALYLLFNSGQPTVRGWGIPMATDIAFALGVLALVGDRVPSSVRVFLLALATVDDIGAILVIALFYSGRVSLVALVFALVLIAVMIVMGRLGVQNVLYYVPFAVLFWFAVLESGVHATIAGVVLGLITPAKPHIQRRAFLQFAEGALDDLKNAVAARDNERAEAVLGEMGELTSATEPLADRLVRILHPWSSYLVLPVFALANAGVRFTMDTAGAALWSPATRGVITGLLLGKVIGIVCFAAIAVRLRIASLMAGVRWSQMAGVGLLGGVGFTVSLFISDLAFTDPAITAQAKIGVLVASVTAGLLGLVVLAANGSRKDLLERKRPASV